MDGTVDMEVVISRVRVSIRNRNEVLKYGCFFQGLVKQSHGMGGQDNNNRISLFFFFLLLFLLLAHLNPRLTAPTSRIEALHSTWGSPI